MKKINIHKSAYLHLAGVAVVGLALIGGSGSLYYHYSRLDNQKPVKTLAAPKALKDKQSVKPAETTPVTATTPTTPSTTTSPKTNTRPTAPASTPQASVAALDQIVAGINQKLARYGVTATLTPPNNSGTNSTWTTLTNDDAGRLQQFGTYLTEEFSKYPTDLVANSGLKIIGLIKWLQVSGGARASVPAPSISGMIYDIPTEVISGSQYAREVISHEYWHYLDFKIAGNYYYSDSQWSACNPSGFNYGSGGASVYGSNYSNTFHPTPGFITNYATTGIEEDRAEMFGWLIYSPSSVKNLGDSGINCKINRLTAIVHQLSPNMQF